jgi:D-tyrosyl-tRNA(Tyr) deacylase
MRAVIQRVKHAHVEVGGSIVGWVDRGLAAFVAIERGDGPAERRWLARKLVELRVHPGDDGRMDRSVKDLGLGLLLVPNFTVAGRLGKGTRPDFSAAASVSEASREFSLLVAEVRALGVPVSTGQFGADMLVHVENDGPVTVVLERRGEAT